MVHNNEHSAEAVNFHMKERRGKKVWPTESTSLGKGSSSIDLRYATAGGVNHFVSSLTIVPDSVFLPFFSLTSLIEELKTRIKIVGDLAVK